MHFEILVEDLSGKKMLDILLPKVLSGSNTWNVHPYKGIGGIPKNMRRSKDASKRILLENLPRLLRGYGRAFAAHADFPQTVVLVCDLDDRCLKTFRAELRRVLIACNPQPTTQFCFAIEEGEAWFLGDLSAVKAAYPKAKDAVLRSYVNDSICGTWEKLADAIFPGGSSALAAKGWYEVGAEKSRWAEAIAPRMDVDDNLSPSFRYFCERLRQLANDS